MTELFRQNRNFMEAGQEKMEKIVSLCKRRAFIYQGSEIYGGLAGMWDYGPHGVLLKNNIQNLWWRMFVEERDDMYGLDAAILMNEKETMLTSILNCSRTDLVLNNPPLTESQRETLEAMQARRAEGNPLHYIIGDCVFMGLTFRVDPRVLIPRPEIDCKACGEPPA